MPLLPDAIRRVLERVLGADGHADQSLRTAVADTAAARIPQQPRQVSFGHLALCRLNSNSSSTKLSTRRTK